MIPLASVEGAMLEIRVFDAVFSLQSNGRSFSTTKTEAFRSMLTGESYNHQLG